VLAALNIQRANAARPGIDGAREREPRDFESSPAIYDSDDPIVSARISVGHRAFESDVWIAVAIEAIGNGVLTKLN